MALTQNLEKQMDQFVREDRPTMTELKRMMSKMLKMDYYKIASYFTCRRVGW